MNTVQRLFSNTFLALISQIVVKASNSVLFILIGRWLGPADSGIFSLGTTYFTLVFGLSALGLHELLVRELAPRREQGRRYLANYLALRVALATATYGLLLVGLRLLLPYSEVTNQVILILALAAIPEAAFSIFQSLFEAHERLTTPMVAALAGSLVKLVVGIGLLLQGYGVVAAAWAVPLGSVVGLLFFLPALPRLFRATPQLAPARLDFGFLRGQLRATPSFFVIHLFSLVDYQTDAFLISLMLTESDLGYYAAAQTILLGFNLMPIAIRAAIYPIMTRYHHDAPDKLAILYEKATHYLFALVLPVAAGITILAWPIIRLIFGAEFGPAVPVLQIMIWAIIFLFLNVPSARLLLINNNQREASAMFGIAMAINVTLNLLLIPRVGIAGAAIARTASNLTLYVTFQIFANRKIMPLRLAPMLIRPLIATALMAAVIWPLREMLVLPILAGAAVYAIAAILLGVFPRQDLAYWQRLIQFRS